MFVLFDLEWTIAENDIRTPTQIAALRTDAAWQLHDSFQALICPQDLEHCDWASIPYRGSSPAEFQAGPTEEICFQKFFRWLAPDDILCCWHYQNSRTLAQLYDRWIGGKMPWR